MQSRRSNLLASIGASVLALAAGALGTASAQEVVHVEPNLQSIAREVERARDIQEIQNVMARRMWYHSVGQNENELALWTRRHPEQARWAQNQGCWVGMQSINVYYNTINQQMQRMDLARIAGANPAVANDWSNRGVGNNAIHTLTSPLIVVADDRQTAKAMWYTPGAILSTPDGVHPAGSWIWERYAADLVNEDGQWRFLHVQVNTDFMNPMGKPLQPQGPDAAKLGAEGGGGPAPGPGAAQIKIPGPDIAKPTYREFGATRVPVLIPRPPVPYRTLSETFQYADCTAGS